jgi:hypothetical protein
MNAGENTLRLPDGYTIEPIEETREHSGEETILMLKRADARSRSKEDLGDRLG